MSVLRIAVDASGGDRGVRSILPAVDRAARHYANVEFHVYGDTSIEPEIERCSFAQSRHNIVVHRAGVSVEMDDSPVSALRHKRDSSMALVLKAVADQQVDGCISAGNTGALVAMGMHFLSCYEGLERPALCKAIPVVDAQVNRYKDSHILTQSYLLDLGANANCSAKQLAQFAALGATLCAVKDNQSQPSVRLLNIGRESLKGSSVIQQASLILDEKSALRYDGFIEADQIFQGLADVIVCDGFSGNIALKASEGMARLVSHRLKQAACDGVINRSLAWLASPLIKQWQKSISPDQYNGAYLLGLKGTVVKSHGAADQQQFFYALKLLIDQVSQHAKYPVNEMETRFQQAIGSINN